MVGRGEGEAEDLRADDRPATFDGVFGVAFVAALAAVFGLALAVLFAGTVLLHSRSLLTRRATLTPGTGPRSGAVPAVAGDVYRVPPVVADTGVSIAPDGDNSESVPQIEPLVRGPFCAFRP